MSPYIRYLALGVCGSAGLASAIAIGYPSVVTPVPTNAAANHSGSPLNSVTPVAPPELVEVPPATMPRRIEQPIAITQSPRREWLAEGDLKSPFAKEPEPTEKPSGNSALGGIVGIFTRAAWGQPPAAPAPAPAPAAAPEPAPAPMPPPAVVQPPEPLPPGKASNVRRDEGDDRLYINVQNTDIREVLQMLSAQGGLNILAGKNVSGNVSANLSGVDVETALAAILKSTGYTARQEGNIIFVGTLEEIEVMEQSADRIISRVYRPNYIKANDLQMLLTPMLTPNIGKVTVSAPSQIDLPADKVKAGGQDFGGNDVVIVRDYEAVLRMVDQIVVEVDTRPQQVAIEATIMSVKLSDQFKMGVSFDLLKNTNARLIVGTPPANLNNLDLASGGLKFGFLDASMTALIEALETVGETNVIASPRLMVLNKQRAEIQIGEELGYVNTTVTENSATQSVSFLEVGTLLRLRPFISTDGLVRLEVHPELSTGNVTVQQGLTLPNKSVTQVTTNIMCRNGNTVVIGGLIREDLKKDARMVPFFGNLPYLGVLFRNKTENVDRVEIIVVITPRIVSDDTACGEGTELANQFSARQATFFDKQSPIAKRNVALHHLRLARASFAAADYNAALKQINWSIHFDPLNREAIMLRNDIVAAGGFEQESVRQHLKQGLATPPLAGSDYSRLGYPWKRHEGFGNETDPYESQDNGVVTPRKSIERRSAAPKPLRSATPPVQGPAPAPAVQQSAGTTPVLAPPAQSQK